MKLVKVECIDSVDLAYEVNELESRNLGGFTIKRYLHHGIDDFRGVNARTVRIHTFEITYSKFYFLKGVCYARFALDTNYDYVLLDGWDKACYALSDRELEAIGTIPQRDLKDSWTARRLKTAKEELLRLVPK